MLGERASPLQATLSFVPIQAVASSASTSPFIGVHSRFRNRQQFVNDLTEYMAECCVEMMGTNHTMKTVMLTYPDFHELPKGVKRMLLASETFFFGEARLQTERPARRSLLTPMEIEQKFSCPPHFSELPDTWTQLLIEGKATDASAVHRNL
jgi:hypothetical protein